MSRLILERGGRELTALRSCGSRWPPPTVSGTLAILHAGTEGPSRLDKTLPQIAYQKAPTPEQGQGLAPSYGLQFFGHVVIDGATEAMTVAPRDVDDNALWSTVIEPSKVDGCPG